MDPQLIALCPMYDGFLLKSAQAKVRVEVERKIIAIIFFIGRVYKHGFIFQGGIL